jgi:hypothetical protein
VIKYSPLLSFRAITLSALYGRSLEFSCFHSFATCPVSVKNCNLLNPLIVNTGDTKLRNEGKKISKCEITYLIYHDEEINV